MRVHYDHLQTRTSSYINEVIPRKGLSSYPSVQTIHVELKRLECCKDTNAKIKMLKEENEVGKRNSPKFRKTKKEKLIKIQYYPSRHPRT
jgi:hypothetical protein